MHLTTLTQRRRTLLANLSVLTIAEVLCKIVTLAAYAILARRLGTAAYGYVEFTVAAAMCAGLVVDLGFGPWGAREIARAPHRAEELISEVTLARLLFALLAYAGLAAVAWTKQRWFGGTPLLTTLLLVFGLSLLLMPLLLQFAFQGLERMSAAAWANMTRQFVFAAFAVLLVTQPADVWRVGLAETLAVLAAGAFCLWAYRRATGVSLRLRWRLSRELFRDGVPIGLSQVFWSVRMFGATVLLGFVAADADVGVFGGAHRILIALHTFVWLYFFNLLPALTRSWHEADGSFRSLVDASYQGVAWLACAAGLIWVLMAPWVMRRLYGAEFVAGGRALQWMAGVCVLAALNGHYRYGLFAAGRQFAEMCTAAGGAVVGLAAVPLGYLWCGVEGAAMGLVAAEVVVWLVTWRLSATSLDLTRHGRLLWRPATATVLLGAGAAWLWRS
ncbi:MAG: oligosaccharide flippase family protein [Phycisphaerae bacterium]|nr:oligosaccharide flippase family protein [Phycisphaerae bacterium]NUQ44776.1 oligosaccharide flippase family protein [Phycisphaerae bacterium]